MAASLNRFELDGLAGMRAERDARLAGLALLGYYHSHPLGSPEPSRADRSDALWVGMPPCYHLIVTPPGAWALYRASEKEWVRVGSGHAGVVAQPSDSARPPVRPI